MYVSKLGQIFCFSSDSLLIMGFIPVPYGTVFWETLNEILSVWVFNIDFPCNYTYVSLKMNWAGSLFLAQRGIGLLLILYYNIYYETNKRLWFNNTVISFSHKILRSNILVIVFDSFPRASSTWKNTMRSIQFRSNKKRDWKRRKRF